jgi:hypothetical protein
MAFTAMAVQVLGIMQLAIIIRTCVNALSEQSTPGVKHTNVITYKHTRTA